MKISCLLSSEENLKRKYNFFQSISTTEWVFFLKSCTVKQTYLLWNNNFNNKFNNVDGIGGQISFEVMGYLG